MKRYIWFVVTAVSFAVARIHSASADVPDDLKAYYSFTGNAHDDSGHGNDGTVSAAGVTLTHPLI